MKLSVRAKIIFITIVILSLAIGSNTSISSYIFQKEYSGALRSEMFVIGQSLKLQLDRLLELGIPVEELVGFERQCQELVEKYENPSYAMVENSEGTILFHNDPSQHGKLFSHFVTSQEKKFHDIAIPVLDQNEKIVAMVRIGYPVKLIAQKTQRLIMYSVGVAGISLILAVIFLLSGIFVWVTRPLKDLSQSAAQLAVGDITCEVRNVHSHDEIGVLSNSFTQLITYFREMAHVVTEIAQGNLSNRMHPKSENDVLGHASLNMLEYLHYIAAVMTKIAEGDLTKTVRVRSSVDAFGRVIQSMKEGLCTLITQIRTSAEQIASTGTSITSLATHDIQIVENVTTSVEHMVSTMNDMRTSVEDVSKNMDFLSSSVEHSSASISEMTASIGHIASNTKTLTDQTHQTIESLNETVQSLEQVVENIDTSKQLSQDTNQNALNGQQAVEQVMSSMEVIHQTVMTAVEAINRFSQRSQDIDSILEVIRNITEQTSLLALNASIIAAQAGIHGRGFAVVADEIKNLADGVAGSTKDIAAIVQSLKNETINVVQTIHEGSTNVRQGVEHTQQAQEALQKIIHSAQRSSSVVTEIADTLHHLMLSSRQVASAMQEVNMMTDDITRETNEQKITMEQINQMIADINNTAAQTHQATTKQLKGVHQILDVATDVSKLIIQNQESSHRITLTSEELSSQADLLIEEVDRFKLPE